MVEAPTCGVCLATAEGEHQWIPSHLKNDDRFTFTCKCKCHNGKEEFQEAHRSKAYNIKHCIYCGKKDFKDFDEVLDHVRRECKKRNV